MANGVPTTGQIWPRAHVDLVTDGPINTGTLRTLGIGAQQAAPGNDARFGTGVSGQNIYDTLVWNGGGFLPQHLGEESLIAPLQIEIDTRVDVPVIDSMLGTNLTTIASGTVYFTYFIPRKVITITRLGVYVTVLGTGTAPTVSRIGLYSAAAGTQNMTMVAHTANIPTMFTAPAVAGPIDQPLVSTNIDGSAGTWPTSLALTRGNMYALAVIVVSTGTMPNFRGMSVFGAATGRLPYKNLAQASQTDLNGSTTIVASSIAPSSLLVGGYCLA